jgi:hypothetical protein
MDADVLKRIGEASEIDCLDRVRTFDLVSVCIIQKRIANTCIHLELFLNLSFEASDDLLTDISVSAWQFKHSGKKFLGGCSLRKKYFFDPVKVMMDECTGTNHLLSLSRSFAVVRNFIHTETISRPCRAGGRGLESTLGGFCRCRVGSRMGRS